MLIMTALGTPPRSTGTALGGDAPGIPMASMWELWVWRSIGRFELPKPSLAAAPSRRDLEQPLPTCWGGISRVPDVSGGHRGKSKAGAVPGMLFGSLLGFHRTLLWGVHHSPDLTDHGQAAVKHSPCSGLLWNMSL